MYEEIEQIQNSNNFPPFLRSKYLTRYPTLFHLSTLSILLTLPSSLSSLPFPRTTTIREQQRASLESIRGNLIEARRFTRPFVVEREQTPTNKLFHRVPVSRLQSMTRLYWTILPGGILNVAPLLLERKGRRAKGGMEESRRTRLDFRSRDFCRPL